MKLGELDIPAAVLDARDRGEFLIFAGSGVSKGGRAQYPDFEGLIRMIEQRSGHRWHGENFDHYLGILDNAGVDVHRSAQRILTNPASRPNPIHSDIMRLFRDPESVRIVTTNFDEHFTTVAPAIHGAIQDYTAPALDTGQLEETQGPCQWTNSPFPRPAVRRQCRLLVSPTAAPQHRCISPRTIAQSIASTQAQGQDREPHGT